MPGHKSSVEREKRHIYWKAMFLVKTTIPYIICYIFQAISLSKLSDLKQKEMCAAGLPIQEDSS